MNTALSSRSKRDATEWLALAIALFITAALIGYELQRGYAIVDATERDRLAVQARVVEDNLGLQLDGIGKALASVRADYARPATQRSGSSSARLKILSDAIPGVRNLLLLDPHGTVIAASDAALLERDFHERDYFAIPNRTRNGNTLYVSPPFTTVLDNFVIVVGRVLAGPRGEFAGVVIAGLDSRYFETVVRSVLYAGDMQATLAHAGGKVFLGLPHNAVVGDLSAVIADAGARHLAPATDAASASASGAAARSDTRLLAVRAISPPELHMYRPLVLVISRSAHAVFQPWRRHAAELGTFFALLLLTTTLALIHSQRRRREFNRLEASTREERRRSAERLEVALRGAELGLWDWDVPNDRFNRNELTRLQLGYAANEIGLEGAAWRALFHPDDAARVLACIDAHFRRETEAYEVEFRIRHKAGHWIWLLSRAKVVERDADGRPLRMAGTHMDITERKRIELELQRLNERLTQLSTTDGLTEVGNRRLFDQMLDIEWARAARKHEPVALLMIDIDHFKDYNDCYGHPAGDECLRRIARLISETVQRNGELVARYGGEEFALLLPGADLGAAGMVGERCLQALAAAKIEHLASPISAWVTMSIGVASAIAGPATASSTLLDAADAALYRAKRSGRGRCLA